MIELGLIVFAGLIITAAFDDWRTRTVPDALCALLWACCLFPPFDLYSAAYAFALFYPIIALTEFFTLRHLLGRGDVLSAGPLVAAFLSFDSFSLFVALVISTVAYLYCAHRARSEKPKRNKPRGIPMLVPPAIGYACGLLATILF